MRRNGRAQFINRFAWIPFLAACLAAVLPAQSQVAPNRQENREEAQPKPNSTQPSAQPNLEDRAQLQAFFDGLIAAQIPARRVPAVTLSVVKDGEILFAKGYGFADREKRIPVRADRTLFRPGSISKLFTWTSVMQLVEQGKLDLNRDVNEYLTQFKVPDTFPQPITLTHLLTHTPGFEDGGLGYLFVKREDQIVPLADSLAAHIPWRVRPPGTYSSYSNWGSALAGLIVANVSGQSFQEYVEQHIFQPLEMNHSTFREPLPPELAGDMAVGYSRQGGRYKPEDFELVSNFAPAGALSATATDMAHFMIAHLQLGRYKEQRILQEETARLMHSQLYTLDPRLPGMAHGFYESVINGQHVIGHGGDTGWFHSDLALFLDQNVGVFVSYVTNGGQARMELMQAFADRYFPQPDTPDPVPPEDFAERGQRFTGSYRFTRHNWSTIEKLMALSNNLSVSLGEGGYLVLSGLFPEPSRWVETEPLLFQQVDGHGLMAFEEDDAGKITHLFLGMLPFMPAYRLVWYQTQGFNLSLVALGLLFSLTIPISAIIRRKQNRGSSAIVRWAVRIGFLTGVLTLIFFVGMVAGVSSGGSSLFYGLPASIKALLILPNVLVLLSVMVALLAAGLWLGSGWSWGRKLHYTLFALSLIGLCWFYNYWNILGFRY